MNAISKFIFFLCLPLVGLPLAALADKTDFGGSEQDFSGRGDNIPPECQIDVPRAASGPFFVKWNCTDNEADRSMIRSELWIFRNDPNDLVSRQIEQFLGFPAAAFIDETQLGVTDFAEGLPISVRLIARDRSGNAAVSPVITVRAQDNSLSTCDVTVITEGTDSDGSTTGIPSLTTFIDNASVVATQVATTTTSLGTTSSVTADPCEIDGICSAGSDLTFSSVVTVLTDSTATGTLTITGSLFAEISGSAVLDSGVITRLDLTGDTTIDNTAATVTLSCTQ